MQINHKQNAEKTGNKARALNLDVPQKPQKKGANPLFKR